MDLKEKHSSVLDARSVRKQTEQSVEMTKSIRELTQKSVLMTGEIEKLIKDSLTMTQEAEKQGKTLMVFTIVTIVFVGFPLSQLEVRYYADIQSSLCHLWRRFLLLILLNFSVTLLVVLVWDTCLPLCVRI